MRVKFFIFFALTIVAFIAMRVHQFQFESESGIRFNVMEFELPGSEENLNALFKEWGSAEMKQFILEQLFLDYFFMMSLFPCIAVLNLWNRDRLKIIEIHQNKRYKHYSLLKVTFIATAILQSLAIVFDLSENIRLTVWINQGFVDNMLLFETLVRLKFLFAFFGIFTGLSGMIYSSLKLKTTTH
jgi:hypothetical protein